MCVCVCVCVREREREREGVCVCEFRCTSLNSIRNVFLHFVFISLLYLCIKAVLRLLYLCIKAPVFMY